jgi:hypothetical protein
MWYLDVTALGSGVVTPMEEICVTPLWQDSYIGDSRAYYNPGPLVTFSCDVPDPLDKVPTIHVPYDQAYVLARAGLHTFADCRKMPSVYYVMPGVWEGGTGGLTATYPWHSLKEGITNLPWGGTDCHFLQGALGTYTPNRNKVHCFNSGKPSRFAVSDDECDTWTEKESVPFKTACFSGFPYSSSKVYVGRDPVRDPTEPVSITGDQALLYCSWDRGDTWTDVTADLWTLTQAMNVRKNLSDQWVGAAGLVTVAPRYQK